MSRFFRNFFGRKKFYISQEAYNDRVRQVELSLNEVERLSKIRSVYLDFIQKLKTDDDLKDNIKDEKYEDVFNDKITNVEKDVLELWHLKEKTTPDPDPPVYYLEKKMSNFFTSRVVPYGEQNKTLANTLKTIKKYNDMIRVYKKFIISLKTTPFINENESNKFIKRIVDNEEHIKTHFPFTDERQKLENLGIKDEFVGNEENLGIKDEFFDNEKHNTFTPEYSGINDGGSTCKSRRHKRNKKLTKRRLKVWK